MEKRMAIDPMTSPCGVRCGQCPHYPEDCAGCRAIEGKVFWLEYTGGAVCDIYHCCTGEKGYAHCGQCSQLPCAHFQQSDPTKTDAENKADFESQMEVLKSLPK